MKREVIPIRTNWVQRIEANGLTYHGYPEETYWDESACYVFTPAETDAITSATHDLYQMCLAAVDHVVKFPELMDAFDIPQAFRPYVVRSWERQDPCVMSRFDLAYNPTFDPHPKMLECNADTALLAIETGPVQRDWLKSKYPNKAQLNFLSEMLEAQYRVLGGMMRGATLTFTSLPKAPSFSDPEAGWSLEEYEHTRYFAQIAQNAGIRTDYCEIGNLGWDGSHIVGNGTRPIQFMSKLYPWEWWADEQIGEYLLQDKIGVLEPVWKMLLSNKAILPVLWALYPDHPNLLPAFFDSWKGQSDVYVRKPILSRQAEGVEVLHRLDPEPQAEGRQIYQEYSKLARFEERAVVLGSWVVGTQPAGVIIRESALTFRDQASFLLVDESARVVPHYVD